ncbi:OB-fold protein [Polaribacter gochangensis]|uniref:OB-fold protein n=1 Tax=Polaribacter gochangensis TaxID=3252903 RepID=UPI003904A03D
MKSKIIKIVLAIFIIAIAYAAYLWFMPHRNVQSIDAFKTVDATELVNEFLTDKEKANALYLDSEEGESKVLIVTGTVSKISKDQLGQYVLLLKRDDDKMGVSCTFTLESNSQVAEISIGSFVKVKGVIRSGAEYDEDLDLIENVILEKSALIK